MTYKKTTKSKGDRLNWISLSKVESVSIKRLNIKGKIVITSPSSRNILMP